TVTRLRRRVASRMLDEKELVVDPAFFYALRDALPRISRVEIAPKRGRSINELTKFRYQVVLHIGEGPETIEPDRWSDWGKDNLDLETIRERLLTEAPPYLAVESVPNQRIGLELALWNALNDPQTQSFSVGALRDNLKQTDQTGIAIDDLDRLAKQLGYQAEINWARQYRDGTYDIVFWRLNHAPRAGVSDRG